MSSFQLTFCTTNNTYIFANSQNEKVSASDLYSDDLLGRAKEFWYKFDNRYEGEDYNDEVKQLYLNCYLMKGLNPDI